VIAWTPRNRRRGRRAFHGLWLGQSISQLGSQISVVVLPLVAAVTLHASPFEVGLLAALETAPYLLIALPAGVLADRADRRQLLILADLGRALALLLVPLAFAVNMLSLPILFAVALVTGTLSVFFDVAYQSYLPRLVPTEQLVDGNQKLALSDAGAHVAGPALAGIILAAVGAAVAVLMDAISFLISALVVGLSPAAARPQAAPRTRTSLGGSMLGGVRLVLRDRTLRDLAASTATFNLASSAILAVFVVFAIRELAVSPAVFGLLYGLGNIGFVLGAAVVGGITRLLGPGRTVFLSAALGTAATVMMPLAVGELAVLMLFAGRFVGAFAASCFNVNTYSVRQARTPDDVLGRVNATFKLLDWGTLPVGALMGGTIGTLLGLRAALVFAAFMGVLSVLWLVRSPVRRMDRLTRVSLIETVEHAPALAERVTIAPGGPLVTR
jgi:MFS family permease